MTVTGQDALEILRSAVRAAGGPSAVARAAGMPRTHLANILAGTRDMGRESAAKLRGVVTLAPEVWVELLAPLPEGVDPAVTEVSA
jgi:plasmid maintenance system antidote protein VapI